MMLISTNVRGRKSITSKNQITADWSEIANFIRNYRLQAFEAVRQWARLKYEQNSVFLEKKSGR